MPLVNLLKKLNMLIFGIFLWYFFTPQMMTRSYYIGHKIPF